MVKAAAACMAVEIYVRSNTLFATFKGTHIAFRDTRYSQRSCFERGVPTK